MHSIVKIILIAVGSLAVFLAVLGIFLPLLPTTPFLLLAAICYSRSSERFYQWLMNNRWFGEYIRNYREGRGMTLKHKISMLCLLWLTMSYSIFFVVNAGWLKWLLCAIAAGVTIHLLKMKTYRSIHHE